VCIKTRIKKVLLFEEKFFLSVLQDTGVEREKIIVKSFAGVKG
jgi:hypothetical protein